MAYRRKQGMSKFSTLQQDFDFHSSSHIKDSNSNGINVAYTSSSPLASHPTFQDHDPQRSKKFDAYGGLGKDEAKGGFWGVLAHKAKSIIDDNKSSQQHDDILQQNLKSTSSNTNTYTPVAPTSQFKPLYQEPESNRKMENPKFRKGLDAITSSLNQLGDTFEKAFEEGKTIVENKTADLRTQMRRKGNVPDDSNHASDVRNPWNTNTNTQSSHETQLKTSRDVAMATAAKAKLLLRELKTVKADLAFAKARCAQLEEESKLLREREGSHKGLGPQNDHDDDDDLIRLQLETLVAEKARLANENEIYSRENRFLREIVEYHQLTMQDVVYLDEGIEEVAYIYPLDSSSLSLSSSHKEEVPPMNTKEDSKSTSQDEVSPSVTLSHTK